MAGIKPSAGLDAFLILSQPGDLSERFGWRDFDATERSLRTPVGKNIETQGWFALAVGERE